MTNLNNQSDFDQWAASYDQDVSEDGLFPFDGYRRVLQRISDHAAVVPDMTVLELGVGTGNLSRILMGQGAHLWGIDFSAQMLTLAQEKLPTAHLLQADLMADLPTAVQRRFPVIVSAYVFHEFPSAEKQRLLQRLIQNQLAPHGRIIIGDIAFADADARQSARLAAGERWDEEYYWSEAEVHKIAAELNLDLTMEPMSSCAYVFILSRRA